MAKKPQAVQLVRYVYNLPDDVKPIYANGLYGGITPSAELVCNFYFEYSPVPNEQSAPVDGGKIQIDKLETNTGHSPDEVVFNRDIKATIIIPIQQISSFANWMLDKLKESGVVLEKKADK